MANAIRALAMDAVQKAKSGHPGMPMGMADIAVALWTRHLRHNPANPHWIGRDRFILSNGHGSMLQYALLHLTGYDLSIEDLKAFRQWHSKTPGHPEVDVTPGVETTTGPLGQGIGNAVGMALAERMLAAEFNRPGFDVIDNYTYCFLGDGCLMEGISHEVCSLAGTWKLNKLIVIYDDNGISIDGKVINWFSDNTRERFEAYGWNVIGPVDGHDIDAVDAAIAKAKTSEDKPTLIIARTVIGKGSPNRAGTSKVHGEALGEEELKLTRDALDWHWEPFVIPEEIYKAMNACEKGAQLQAQYDELFARYRQAYPDLASELTRRLSGQLPSDFDDVMQKAIAGAALAQETVATRKASQKALNAFAQHLPELLGGSADLTGSNLTNWTGVEAMRPDTYLGRHINYGVREFGMSAIQNGIALYRGFVPFSATFLTFSDYSRNAIRMAALMKQRSIFVFTHDSIGLGEDGPTHQSIEHIPSLRLIPNLNVWRPCDTVEALVAWESAVESDKTPSVIIGSRQNIEFTKRSPEMIQAQAKEALQKGAYVMLESGKGADCIDCVLLATGSEIPLAVKARAVLEAKGLGVRVVSMPCVDLFDRLPEAQQKALLTDAPKVAIEASVTGLWYKYVKDGRVIGIDTFGESAPASVLWEKFGFTVDRVVQTVEQLIQQR
ncbi:MAG TPA: transketolase [Candidatus Aphodousia faecipullorum]|nr:transketolase [Candidatus Aphodousia faecipullorum]